MKMVGKCPNEGLLDEAKPKEVINLLYEPSYKE